MAAWDVAMCGLGLQLTDTKLVPSWLVGKRDTECAIEFVNDLASRLRHRVQVTSDGHRSYLIAIEEAFGATVDYAMLIKLYGKPLENETRYSPAECIGIETKIISGDPDVVCEFLRETIGQPGKASHLHPHSEILPLDIRRGDVFPLAAIALHYMNYNFCRIHQTLRITPAMAAGITDHVWDTEDVVRLLEASEPQQLRQKRRPYRKRAS